MTEKDLEIQELRHENEMLKTRLKQFCRAKESGYYYCNGDCISCIHERTGVYFRDYGGTAL